MKDLKDIGFYTLSDDRVKQQSHKSPLWRCELILTDKCNFKCPYCRGLRDDLKGTMSFERAERIVDYWIAQGLKNVRFSGGEPTLYNGLSMLVNKAKRGGVEHIALSSNGSASAEKYMELMYSGVNDISFSLDACCSSFAEKMSGGYKNWDRLVDNIKNVSERIYTTVGIVLTDDNVKELVKIVEFASNTLKVHDIRIISAAQNNFILSEAVKIPQEILDKHPILKYRVANILKNRNVRGIKETDCHKCSLVLDDMAVAGDYHFPCIIYMREGGDPIGKISNNIRQERLDWFNNHDTNKDPICKGNCLDVCIDFNNKCDLIKKV